MPKKPIDYSKTIIYKLVCNDLNIKETYVGHTTDFKSRKALHKSSVEYTNHKGYNTKKSIFIREHGGWDNWSMIQQEKFPCNDIHEAITRERYWYEELNAKLNTNIPNRSTQEYREQYKEQLKQHQKEYREKNREHIAEKTKHYCQNNKEKIKEAQKLKYEKNRERILLKLTTKYECECGVIVCEHHKNRHFQSKKHCQFIEHK